MIVICVEQCRLDQNQNYKGDIGGILISMVIMALNRYLRTFNVSGGGGLTGDLIEQFKTETDIHCFCGFIIFLTTFQCPEHCKYEHVF